MKKRRSRLAVVLLTSVMIGSLAGCTSSKEPTSGAASEATSETPAETKITATDGTTESSADSPDVKSGGNVMIAVPVGPATFFLPQSSSTNDRFAASPVIEPLGRAAPDGSTYPWLAEKFITDGEALTFTIKLREGVYFHDGSLCDAKAVAWNIQQYIENGKASEIGSPSEVAVIDDRTVQLTYSEWANNWDSVIGDIFISSMEAYETNGVEWCKINPVGTGAFKFVTFIADNSVKYVKNEDYRLEGLPYVDSLEIDIITDKNTQVSALLNNEVHVALRFEDKSQIDMITAAGFESIGTKNANIADIKHIIWNSLNTDYPMGDLKVRQAIMHSIDWENVALALSGGLGEATPLFCTSDSWAYSPEAKFYEYDVDLAKQMLAEAGYPNGFDTKIYTRSVNADSATAFQACLKQIGINGEIVTLDASALDAMQAKDDIDGFIANRGASKMDFTNNYIRLYSSEGIKNHGIMLRPPEFEEPLFAARAAKTVDEKKENLQKASLALTQDYVMITPLSVVYYQSFADSALKDTGIYESNLEQWSPEAMYWDK